MEEPDRVLDPAADRIGHLDHDAHVFGLNAVLVGRAAVAEMVAELDRSGHRVADLGQDRERLAAEIDGSLLVIAFPGQHFLAHIPLHGEPVIGHCFGDLLDLADQMLGKRRQQLRPVRRHHVVVGWRDRRRERDLELHIGGNDGGPLQPLEQAPGCDRHLGIAGFERAGIGLGAGLDAKPRDFAQHLAVPLRELEGRHVCGDLDRRVFGKNILQKADQVLRMPVSPSGRRSR